MWCGWWVTVACTAMNIDAEFTMHNLLLLVVLHTTSNLQTTMNILRIAVLH